MCVFMLWQPARTGRRVTWATCACCAGDKLGQFERAIADFTRVLELDPSNANAYLNRGSTHDSLGQHAKAAADYSKALDLDRRLRNGGGGGVAAAAAAAAARASASASGASGASASASNGPASGKHSSVSTQRRPGGTPRARR